MSGPMVTCFWCHGTGQGERPGHDCPVCEGAGGVECVHPQHAHHPGSHSPEVDESGPPVEQEATA